MTQTIIDLSSENLGEKVATLSREVDDLKGKVYENINSKFEEYSLAFDKTSALKVEVEDLAKNVEKVNKVCGSIEKHLSEPAANTIKYQQKLANQDDIINVLSTLCQIQDLLNLIDDLIEMGQFYSVAINILHIRKLLESVDGNFCDFRILKLIREEFVCKKSEFRGKLEETWCESFTWSHGGLIIYRNKLVNGYISKLAEISVSMHMVEILQTRLSIFVNNIIAFLVKPAVNENNQCNIFVCDTEDNQVTLQLKPINDNDTAYIDLVYQNIKTILEFCFLHGFFNEEGVMKFRGIEHNSEEEKILKDNANHVRSLFAAMFWKQAEETLISEVLDPFSTKATKPKETKYLIEKTKEFLNFVEVYIPKCAPKILNLVVNLSVNVTNRQQQDLLFEAREIITSETFANVIEVSEDEEIGTVTDFMKTLKPQIREEIQKDKFLQELNNEGLELPKCKILESTKKIINFIFEILEEACDSSQARSIQLFYTSRDILELFRAISPLVRKKAERNNENMIFHNDCMFIAHHLLFLGHRFRSIPLPIPEACTFVDMVTPFRELGQNAYYTEMEIQNKKIQIRLADCNNFKKTTDDAMYTMIEGKFREILERIQHLHSIWKVLPVTLHKKSITNLFEIALERITKEIIALGDIGANEASQLITLMMMWKSVINRILPRAMDTIPCFRRFFQLIDILDMSMKEIVSKWENKEFDFDRDSIRLMIRALFQDTDLRQENLSKIK